MKKYRDVRYLRDAVEVRQLTQKVIAEECDCSIATISYYCKKYGIKPQGYKRRSYDKNMSNHINIEKGWIELLNGTVLGGASLRPISKTSAVYEVSSRSELYVNTIKSLLDGFDIKSGNIRSSSGRFQLTTLSYVEFYEVWGKWYGDDGKHIPQEIHSKFYSFEGLYDLLTHYFMKTVRFYYKKEMPIMSFTMGRYDDKEVDQFFGDLFSLINNKQNFMVNFNNTRRQQLLIKGKAVDKFMSVLSDAKALKSYVDLIKKSSNENYKNIRKYFEGRAELKYKILN